MTTTERETCECGHDRDTHHREVESSGDVEQARVYRYVACLGAWCDCRLYRRDER